MASWSIVIGCKPVYGKSKYIIWEEVKPALKKTYCSFVQSLKPLFNFRLTFRPQIPLFWCFVDFCKITFNLKYNDKTI
jgi:hypothetical protein